MMQRLRVFVSARDHELAADRRAVAAALTELGVAVVGDEQGEAAGRALRRSDLYVGLAALSYDDGMQADYLTAVGAGLPIRIYHRLPSVGQERDARLAALLEEAGNLQVGAAAVATYDTPSQLAELVRRDVEGLARFSIRIGPYVYRHGARGGRLEAAGEPPSIERRPQPQGNCEQPPRPVGDRSAIRDRILSALDAGQRLVGVFGEPGMGKSVVLDMVASMVEPPADGVVCVAGAEHTNVDDVVADVWQRYYDAGTQYVPDTERLGLDLGPLQAVVTIDDVPGEAEALERLQQLMPASRFVVAGAAEDDDPLGGLKLKLDQLTDPDAILGIFEEKLGIPIPTDARSAALELCRKAGASPGHVDLLATLAGGSDQPLDLWATALTHETSPLAAAVQSAVGQDGMGVLDVLASGGPAAAVPEALLPLLGVDAAHVATVQQAGLIASDPRGFLTSAAAKQLGGETRADAIETALQGDLMGAALQWATGAPAGDVVGARSLIGSVMQMAAGNGLHSHVVSLARLVEGPFALAGQLGAWRDTLEQARASAEEDDDDEGAAWATHQLGTASRAVGNVQRAQELLSRASDMWEALGDDDRAALARDNLQAGGDAGGQPTQADQTVADPQTDQQPQTHQPQTHQPQTHQPQTHQPQTQQPQTQQPQTQLPGLPTLPSVSGAKTSTNLATVVGGLVLAGAVVTGGIFGVRALLDDDPPAVTTPTIPAATIPGATTPGATTPGATTATTASTGGTTSGTVQATTAPPPAATNDEEIGAQDFATGERLGPDDSGVVDFGDVAVGDGRSTEVAVTNQGDGPLVVAVQSDAVRQSEAFRLIDDSCSGLTLQPGVSCFFYVEFSPTESGDASVAVPVTVQEGTTPLPDCCTLVGRGVG